MLQRVLDDESRTSATPDEAVLDAGNWQPAVILLDLYFEGEPVGLEAIGRLHEAAPRAMIIVMSGMADPSLLRQAQALGAC